MFKGMFISNINLIFIGSEWMKILPKSSYRVRAWAGYVYAGLFIAKTDVVTSTISSSLHSNSLRADILPKKISPQFMKCQLFLFQTIILPFPLLFPQRCFFHGKAEILIPWEPISTIVPSCILIIQKSTDWSILIHDYQFPGNCVYCVTANFTEFKFRL